MRGWAIKSGREPVPRTCLVISGHPQAECNTLMRMTPLEHVLQGTAQCHNARWARDYRDKNMDNTEGCFAELRTHLQEIDAAHAFATKSIRNMLWPEFLRNAETLAKAGELFSTDMKAMVLDRWLAYNMMELDAASFMTAVLPWEPAKDDPDETCFDPSKPRLRFVEGCSRRNRPHSLAR